MAWCKLEDTFRYHPKFKVLARELGISRAEARGYLAGLWSWSLVNAADGELTDFDHEDIAAACDANCDPTLLVSALISSKLLETHRKRLFIHDWMERADSYKKAKQKRRERAKSRRVKSDTSTDMSRDTSTDMSRPRGEERRGEETRGDERRKNKPQTTTDLALFSDTEPPPWADSKPLVTAVGGHDVLSSQSADIQTVWGAYREEHPSCTATLKSSRKEYKLIQARLRDGFSVSDLVAAVRGYHRSPFHNGLNDSGKKYLGLELMMRDAPHVEAGIEMANDPDIQRRAAMGKRGLESAFVGESWLAEQRAKEGSDAGD